MPFLRSCLVLLLFSLSAVAADPYSKVFEQFEGDGYGEWGIQGMAFDLAPSHGGPKKLAGKISGYSGNSFACSFHERDGVKATGTLRSPHFRIENNFITFLIAGGNSADALSVALYIDDDFIFRSSGNDSNQMERVAWDVRPYKGKQARIFLFDLAKDGYLLVDDIIFSNEFPNAIPLQTKKTPQLDLVASKSIPGLLLPSGTQATVFADHAQHQLYSPTALCFDEKGRMLVSETHRFRFGVEDNRSNLYWLLDDLSAQTVEDRRAMHEKWQEKKSLKSLTEKSEKIRLLEDTDGDGLADRSQIYADGFNDVLDGTGAGVFHLNGSTYFSCIPKVWQLRDRNGDGTAEEREVVQDGLGVRVSFSGHDLNGFALGPDGRIYGTIGDRGFNVTTKEGKRYPYPDQGCIFRFEPDGRNFEVLHTGLRNPKEIAFDKWGNGISVDNNSDQDDLARIVYLMEGADSGWRMGHQTMHTFHSAIGIPDLPINVWMSENMWKPAQENQPAWFLPPVANLTSGPSGLTYYPGTGFSTECKDRFLICDYRGGSATSGIWSFAIQSKGAGMEMTDSAKFNWGVAATDVEFGYDGKLYVTDFITGWESHAAGRVYSLSDESTSQKALQEDTLTLLKTGLANKSSRELALLMDHPDLRIRTRAHLALAEKNDASPVFANIIRNSSSPLHRLHATWGLWKIARTNNRQSAVNLLVRLLSDPDPEIRAQAARALGETPLKNYSTLRTSLVDPSRRVRSFAALSLARLQDKESWSYVLALLKDNNNRDASLRHAGVMALIGCGDAQKITALKDNKNQALRLAAVIALRTLKDPGLIEFISDRDPIVADEAIRAIHDLPLEEGRPNLARLLDDYAPGGKGRELSRMQMRRLIHSGFRFGTPESARRLLLVAQNPKIHLDERLEALRLVNLWPEPPAVDQSTGLFSPLAPRNPADLLPFLQEQMPSLLKLRGRLLTKVLAISNNFQLSDDDVPTPFLTELLADSSRDLLPRKEALTLFVKRNPEKLVAKLKKLSLNTSDPLSSDALAHLSKISPADSLAAVEHATLHGDVSAKRNAWDILAKWKGKAAAPIILNGLKRLQNGEIRPDVQLELLEAAGKRTEQNVAVTLAAYQESLKEAGSLAEWKSLFYGGDPKRGAKIFKSHPAAQCARCHRAKPGHAEGGEAGPNLYGIGEVTSARSLVESLVSPSAQIASGYGIASITLSNDELLSGNIMSESAESLDLLVGSDLWRIRKSDIKQRGEAVSTMPPMGLLLSHREIRDVVAWLSDRRGERITRDLPEAKPYLITDKPVAAVPTPTKSTQPEKAQATPKPSDTPKEAQAVIPGNKNATTANPTQSPAEEVATTVEQASPAPQKAPLQVTSNEPREDATSGKKTFWTLFVLFWIGICLVPVLIGLKNR